MAIKVAQLHNKNFFSHVGTEYICTGFMFDSFPMGSLEDQLSKEGFMPGIDVTQAEQVEATQYEGLLAKPGDTTFIENVTATLTMAPGAPTMGTGY